MSKDFLQRRSHGNETGGVIAKMLLVLSLAIAATVGSFFVFPGFWYGHLADYLLGNETVEAPKTDSTAAESAEQKLADIKNRFQGLNVVDANAADSVTLNKLELDSYIAKICDELDEVEIPEEAGVDPQETKKAGCDIVHAMDSLQIELRDDSFVVLGNIDLDKVAGMAEENTEFSVPEEFRRRVCFSAEYSMATKDRTVELEMQDLILGQTSLQNSLLAPVLAEMREKIDEFVEAKIKSIVNGEFKRTSDTKMSCTLPEGVDDVKVTPDGIKIDYAARP